MFVPHAKTVVSVRCMGNFVNTFFNNFKIGTSFSYDYDSSNSNFFDVVELSYYC